jgi:hypothetical protein
MAIWIKWTPKQEKMWTEWVAQRPPVIQEMIAKYDLRMDRLYELTTTGQRVVLHSLSEDGTLTVNILLKFNRHRLELVEKGVFGINPAHLKECDWDGEVEDGALCENLED